MAYEFHSLSLTPSVAVKIIPKILEIEGVSTFTRRFMVQKVEEDHQKNGGLAGRMPITGLVKKALSTMKSIGYLSNPTQGNYVVIDREIPVIIEEELIEQQPIAAKLIVEKEIGNGKQAVYVYFFSNDKELALSRGLEKWECKVGLSRIDPVDRVYTQINHTACHSLPVIGLIIWTEEAGGLEQFIHGALKMRGSRISSTASMEWFVTSPSDVENIYSLALGIS